MHKTIVHTWTNFNIIYYATIMSEIAHPLYTVACRSLVRKAVRFRIWSRREPPRRFASRLPRGTRFLSRSRRHAAWTSQRSSMTG